MYLNVPLQGCIWDISIHNICITVFKSTNPVENKAVNKNEFNISFTFNTLQSSRGNKACNLSKDSNAAMR